MPHDEDIELDLVDSAPEIGAIENALFYDAPLPTIVVDGDTFRIVAANAATEERYGYSPRDLMSMRYMDLVDPAVPSRVLGTRETPSGKIVLERQRHLRKDGTAFPAHCASREFMMGEKRVLMLVITELSELRALDSEERFAEKMEALARLGGGIAHEFNNLLTAILATTDLALGGAELPPGVRQDLEKIHESGGRAARITRQLMAFSGGQTVSLRPVRIDGLVEQLVPLIKHLLPLGVALDVAVHSKSVIEVDPVYLEQVVLNLVVNSIEAMPARGSLRVVVEDMNDFITILIADDGPGMDEVTLARLFEPFHSTRGPSGGRGLGLASVYGSVRQMGGHVDIESRPGNGTQVRILFPKAEAEPAVATPTPAPKTDLTGGEVILVVEDEPGVRAPICRKLRSLGYFVLEANHGEDALKVMQEHHSPVHLVISDVMMPEMDGTELVALLRSWYPRLRVLFISGYSPQYLEAQGGKTVWGEAFLAKPFSLDAFAHRVREVLDKEWDRPDPEVA